MRNHSAILPSKAIYPFLEAVGPLLSAGIEHDNPERTVNSYAR
jgi:hypothetical protein